MLYGISLNTKPDLHANVDLYWKVWPFKHCQRPYLTNLLPFTYKAILRNRTTFENRLRTMLQVASFIVKCMTLSAGNNFPALPSFSFISFFPPFQPLTVLLYTYYVVVAPLPSPAGGNCFPNCCWQVYLIYLLFLWLYQNPLFKKHLKAAATNW